MITTDPQEELLTQVDEHNQIIGSITRGSAHSTLGTFYRTIYVLVKDNQGKVLIQKRSTTKDLYPNCWDLSVGGHVNFGHSYPETAVREVGEELGLSVTESDLKYIGEVLVKLPNSGEYFDVFEYNLKPNQEINILTLEIGEIKWMSIDEIKKSMETKSLNWYERPLQVIASLY
ncbi:NUDIX domain-containing protein [Candidatus Shapirobacteria bacterium]|nr:NUDIX domain-containing protein [Candidatus Shapirobacteria bacterium]